MDIRMLFNCNPNKFRDAAKDRSFEEFIKYLEEQPNFKVIEYFSEDDKRELYCLAKLNIK
ncbi:MAG: hypothetical protein ACI35S_05475 [Anaeroplasma sp.]